MRMLALLLLVAAAAVGLWLMLSFGSEEPAPVGLTSVAETGDTETGTLTGGLEIHIPEQGLRKAVEEAGRR